MSTLRKRGSAAKQDDGGTKDVTDEVAGQAVDESPFVKPEHLVAIKFPLEEGKEDDHSAHDQEVALWIKKQLEGYGATVSYTQDDNIMLVNVRKEMQPREWEDEVAPSDKVMHILHIMRKVTLENSDEPKAVEELMNEIEDDGRCVLWSMKEHELIDFLPLHDRTIMPSWGMFWEIVSPSGLLFSAGCGSKDNMVTVGLYYGEEIVYYWVYMTIYSLWLSLATIIGFYFEFKPKPNPSHEHFESSYAWIMIFWTLGFLLHLSYSIEVINTILDSRLRLPDFDLGVRSGFDPEGVRTNSVTGVKELYYPAEKRRPKIMVAGLVTMLGLVCAFGIMYFSLNLNGYINPKSVLYLESMSGLSGPGKMFDKDGAISWAGPTIFHAFFVLLLNMTFAEIQGALVEWENYRTQEQADRVLASRRFLFEALDCFLAIFYLVVMERNLKYLRQEIIALFTFDQCRRIFLETVIPLVLQEKPEIDASDGIDEVEQAKMEFELWEKESFDDYLEMIVQMGYIILVPTAVPLAAAFAFFGNFFEIGSDSWRLCNLERRPFPRRTNNGIGFWNTANRWMFYTCIVSNVFTVLLYTNQLNKWFPVLFPECRGCPDTD